MTMDGRGPDNAVYAVTVDRQVVWSVQGTGRDYRVACGTCGAAEGLSLRVGRRPYTAGDEDAWVVCPDGHEFTDPLVYPRLVRALIDWDHEPAGTRPPLEQMLLGIGWSPHYPYLIDFDHSDIYPIREWHRMPARWSPSHPELSAAAGWPEAAAS